MNLRTVVIQVNTRDNLAENLSNVERFLDQAADMGTVRWSARILDLSWAFFWI